MSIEPDSYPNDISLETYEQSNVSSTLRESGSGNSYDFKSTCIIPTADDSCFAFNIYDSLGDCFCCHEVLGSGHMNISYDGEIQRLDGRVYSSGYESNGEEGIPANETYLFENGEFVECCRYDASYATRWCGLDSAIDIMFTFDTSFSMDSTVWRQQLFAVLSDTRVGYEYEINFALTDNLVATRFLIDTNTATPNGQQFRS